MEINYFEHPAIIILKPRDFNKQRVEECFWARLGEMNYKVERMALMSYFVLLERVFLGFSTVCFPVGHRPFV
jgi:hypothetical protein